MTAVPDYDSIDWVAVARSCGIYIGVRDEDIELQLITNDERSALAEHYVQQYRSNPKLPRSYIRDSLDERVWAGQMTTLDKAIVVHRYKRLINTLQ